MMTQTISYTHVKVYPEVYKTHAVIQPTYDEHVQCVLLTEFLIIYSEIKFSRLQPDLLGQQ